MRNNRFLTHRATSISAFFRDEPQAIAAKSNSPVTINGGVVVKSVDIKTGSENFVINGMGAGPSYFVLKQARIVE